MLAADPGKRWRHPRRGDFRQKVRNAPAISAGKVDAVKVVSWIKGIAGVVCVLLGLVWIGQGTNILPGSFMSGQRQWVIIGLVLVVVGAWLAWSLVRGRGAKRAGLA